MLTASSASGNASPETIYQQDLASAAPGPTYSGPVSNTGLSVTAGNVDIFGNGSASGTAGFYTLSRTADRQPILH